MVYRAFVLLVTSSFARVIHYSKQYSRMPDDRTVFDVRKKEDIKIKNNKIPTKNKKCIQRCPSNSYIALSKSEHRDWNN